MMLLARRIASLNHETFDVPMEYATVVVTAGHTVLGNSEKDADSFEPIKNFTIYLKNLHIERQ